MACALPYHATREFARLASLLRLQGPRWAFLNGEGAAPLPRSVLVQRCIAERVQHTAASFSCSWLLVHAIWGSKQLQPRPLTVARM